MENLPKHQVPLVLVSSTVNKTIIVVIIVLINGRRDNMAP